DGGGAPRPRGGDLVRAVDPDPADGDDGHPGPLDRAAQSLEPLRGRQRRARFRRSGEDRTEADVVRALGRVDLRVRMRADADQGLRPEDGAHRLHGQVVLSEMYAVRLCEAGNVRTVVDQEERPSGAQLARL